jgi:hypothetical protein
MPSARHSRGPAETVLVEVILKVLGYPRLKEPGAPRQNPFQWIPCQAARCAGRGWQSISPPPPKIPEGSGLIYSGAQVFGAASSKRV